MKLGASEIEGWINRHENVIESIAVEISTETFNKLVLIIQPGFTASKESLGLLLPKIKESIERDFLNEEGVVDRIIYLRDFPKNANGKILRPLVKKIVNRQPYEVPANIISTNPIKELEEAIKK